MPHSEILYKISPQIFQNKTKPATVIFMLTEFQKANKINSIIH